MARGARIVSVVLGLALGLAGCGGASSSGRAGGRGGTTLPLVCPNPSSGTVGTAVAAAGLATAAVASASGATVNPGSCGPRSNRPRGAVPPEFAPRTRPPSITIPGSAPRAERSVELAREPGRFSCVGEDGERDIVVASDLDSAGAACALMTGGDCACEPP